MIYGPLWDFEYSIGIGWYDGERPNPNHTIFKHLFMDRLLEDPYFKSIVVEEWNSIRSVIKKDLLSFITEESNKISLSEKNNFKRWPILNSKISAGGIPLGSYEAELACDLSFLQAHIDWLDTEIQSWVL